MGSGRDTLTLSGFSGRQVASVGSRKELKSPKVRRAFQSLKTSRSQGAQAYQPTVRQNRGAA